MSRVSFGIHEHLATPIYRGDFDKIIDLGIERIGQRGIFSVASTGDDRLKTDRRYEKFADSAKKSRKYPVIDLNGRGMYVEGANLWIFSGIEIEMGRKHLLVLGLERDTVIMPDSSTKFSETAPEEFLSYLDDKNVLSFGAHLFYGDEDGFGPYITKSLRRGESGWLNQLTGIEIYNNQLNFPFSKKTFQANEEVIPLATELQKKFPHLAFVYTSDSHSRYEFGRVVTKIDNPRLNKTNSGDEIINKIRASLERLTLEESISDNHPQSRLIPLIGSLGFLQHGLDLKFIHPHRLKREERLNKQ